MIVDISVLVHVILMIQSIHHLNVLSLVLEDVLMVIIHVTYVAMKNVLHVRYESREPFHNAYMNKKCTVMKNLALLNVKNHVQKAVRRDTLASYFVTRDANSVRYESREPFHNAHMNKKCTVMKNLALLNVKNDVQKAVRRDTFASYFVTRDANSVRYESRESLSLIHISEPTRPY